MTDAPKYSNSPITEAIMDIRVLMPGAFGHDMLKLNLNKDLKDYPSQEALFEAMGRMEVGPLGGAASVEQQQVGWKFTSVDQKRIIQTRTKGFTFSRLAPYDCWAAFRDEARLGWDAYLHSLMPDSVQRIAVRYINRIDIPQASVDLKDYFRTSPEISPAMPQHLEGFFMQLRFPYPSASATCLINQTIVPPVRENTVSIILDIDLFSVREFRLEEHDNQLWDSFEALHEAKNMIFEASITDKARRLFESCPS